MTTYAIHYYSGFDNEFDEGTFEVEFETDAEAKRAAMAGVNKRYCGGATIRKGKRKIATIERDMYDRARFRR